MKICLAVVALLPVISPVAIAQRAIDARTAFARPGYSLAVDTSPGAGHKSRTTFALQRVVFGAWIGFATSAPFAYLAFAGESTKLLWLSAGWYLITTAAGAALVESDECSGRRRFVRALGGSFLGGIVGGSIAGAINGRKDAAAVATGLFALLSAPVGAAVLLTPCN